MSTEIAVLRALLRLSRRRAPATLQDLLDRVGGDALEVQRAIGSLARAQLVQRQGSTARLSLAGLAVACAATANARRAKTVARPSGPSRAGDVGQQGARVLPLVARQRDRRQRRHHAA